MDSPPDANSLTSSAPIALCLASDSPRLRTLLSDAVGGSGDCRLLAGPVDPVSLLESALPADVIVLETGPSRIEALILVKKLSARLRIPLIVVAQGAVPGAGLCIDLLNAGAIDVLPRPASYALEGAALAERIVASARLLRRCRPSSPRPPVEVTPAQRRLRPAAATAKPVLPFVRRVRTRSEVPPTGIQFHPRQVLLIGASTGGTEAIHDVLHALPPDLPGICIVQHIPAKFSKSFADRLNAQCSFEVREAVDGDVVRSGLALVAPGGYHMELHWKRDHYIVRLTTQAQEHHQRPAVDVLFRTAAAAAGAHALAVLLTGMGRDGALGMVALKEAGAVNLAQDKASCVVYGMPAAAVELEAVNQIVPLKDMPQVILRRLSAMRRPLAA